MLGAGGAGGAAAGGSGGARRRGLPGAVLRVAGQADRPQPLRAQRAYAIGNSGDPRPAAGGAAAGGGRATRWCGTRRRGRWGGSVEALQVGAGERRRGRCRGARDQAEPEVGGAGGVAGLGEGGGGLEQRLGEVRGERRARCSASASAAAGSPWRAERGGEERVGEGVVGVGGERARRARRGGRPVARGGGGAGAQDQAVGVGRRRARRPRSSAARARSGWPAASHWRAASVEDDRAQRRRRWRGWGSRARLVRSCAAVAWAPRAASAVGLAEPRRHAAAGALPERGLLAGGGGIGGDGGGAVLGGADLGRAPARRRGGRGGGAVAWRRPRLWTADDPAAAPDARPWLLGGGAGRKPAGWRRLGTTRSPERAAAMRAAGVEPVDWADAGAVDAAIAAAAHLLVSVPPEAAGDPVLARHGAALAAARPAGSAISRRPGSTATGRAAGSTRTSPLAPVERARAAGGWRRRRRGWPAGCRCTSSGSPASTGRGGARSTGCARDGRSGW